MRGFLIFILGIAIGAAAMYYYRRPEIASTHRVNEPATAGESSSVINDARGAAASARDSIGEKLEDWHLTGDDIKRDLAKTGEVVRTNAKAAGSHLADAATKAKVLGSIKTKLALDKELSARAINVDYDHGKVTLHGTVASEALIGKAVALALDTNDVTQVNSKLRVQAAP